MGGVLDFWVRDRENVEEPMTDNIRQAIYVVVAVVLAVPAWGLLLKYVCWIWDKMGVMK